VAAVATTLVSSYKTHQSESVRVGSVFGWTVRPTTGIPSIALSAFCSRTNPGIRVQYYDIEEITPQHLSE